MSTVRLSNLDVARLARLRPIEDVAADAGLGGSDFERLGANKGKLTWGGVKRLTASPTKGKLILVTAMTPTPAGEGKTTVTVGLSQGLNRIGKRAVAAIREPALGPVFGVKGGACGGGYSQVLPIEDINLFFTGDFPAVAAAHNLLSALVDAHIQNGLEPAIDIRRVFWPRTVDMNDRALRDIVVGLGGKANGYPREDGFVITPASEVMAVLGMSTSIADLKARLGRIVVATTPKGVPVTAGQIGAVGPMAALLVGALRPNLVQTTEGHLATVHCGPFANIAHGTSSVVATNCALGLADYVVTEGGFASDLGAQKFLSLVAPQLDAPPSGIVLVATVRALKHHGGGDLGAGLANLDAHLAHLRQYGLPVLVAVNKFDDDDPADLEAVRSYAGDAVVCDPWSSGGAGCEDLAQAVAAWPTADGFQPIVPSEGSFEDKLEAIVTKVYGGEGFTLSEAAKSKVEWLRKHGFGDLPVCVAKTQSSLSDDPARLGRPSGFTVNFREARLSAGAGFVVFVAGETMLMPGLGPKAAAYRIDVDDDGQISGMY
ncbi:MAG: formate--tetrahydrofolate ligase [Armatimonadetes bacterium]|nr:formate--tetrahydrofolate ligase [Armatimonadota bacterium]